MNCRAQRERVLIPESSMDVLLKSVDELGLCNKTIALELDYLPLGYYNTLREKLPEAKLVNSSDLFVLARSVNAAFDFYTPNTPHYL